MKTSLFNYALDSDKIAQMPMSPRDHSKLLYIDRKSWKTKDLKFFQVLDFLWENDVLVFNETKVIKARLKWYVILKDWRKKEVEIVLLSQKELGVWECAVFPWERLKPGKIVRFDIGDSLPSPGSSPGLETDLQWTIKEITYSGRIIEFNISWAKFFEEIDRIWIIPLPPYIKESNQTLDQYNTVLAKVEWSAAAPTAGLHFTEELLSKLKEKWVKIEKVLLHIWLWTFKTITAENLEDHEIHKEYIEITEETSGILNNYKKTWKRIIAVWTTVIRTLESMTNENWVLQSWEKNTDIFIYPWYSFRFVDSVFTNFHLPQSSLLMLVSAFYEREKMLEIYEYAKKNDYRFFSFWDAMFLE
jgi:S-adenosylmethionine:tRNA ribosyltransferase-isomerase